MAFLGKVNRVGCDARLWMTLAVVGVLAGSALGQVRQVQMGVSMDANPQVGSGGSNRPVSGYVPINGNEIISGNVSGLKYFHGTVGTMSQNQFRGSLGTSSLQGFARQSAGSVSGSLDQVYYLPSSTVASAQSAYYTAPVGGGFDTQLVPRNAVSPIATAAQISGLPRSISQAGLPYANVDRTLRIGTLGTTGLEGGTLFALRPTESPGTLIDTMTPASPRPEMDTTVRPQRVPGNVDGATESTGGTDTRIIGQSSELQRAMVSAPSVDRRVGDASLKLLDELRQWQGDTGTEPVALPGLGRELPALSDVDPLTGQPRRTISGSAGGGATSAGRAVPGATPGAPGTPGGISEAALTARRLEDLPTSQLTAGSRLKPARITPVISIGMAVTDFDVTMALAGQALKEGKYLDALDTFQAALAARPADPLALVGRAHAEMGAGLYASAANDLKFVFTRRPELISVKYDVDSFIPAARHEFLLNDLLRLAKLQDSGNLASFLYGYLCYQTGRTEPLEAELKAWGEREGHDGWQAVVRRAWGATASEEPK